MHDHMVDLDPWHRLARSRAHGRVFLRKLGAEARRSRGFVLVAEADGEPVGAAFAYTRRISAEDRMTQRPTRIGYLSDVSVLPGWQRRGIGSRILREVEARFRRAGCDQISLSVFFPNQGAQRLYRRVGYSPRGIYMVKRLAPPPQRWPPERRRANPERS